MSEYTEENGIYKINCSNAIWSTDQIHQIYNSTTDSFLSDVDFIIETQTELILVEYKNACIPGASCPGAFNPQDSKTVNKLCRKFYDSMVFLRGIGKKQLGEYVCILEYPNSDSITRRLLRDRLKKHLPFRLQSYPEVEEGLINAVFVLSIDDWNNHPTFGRFPLSRVI